MNPTFFPSSFFVVVALTENQFNISSIPLSKFLVQLSLKCHHPTAPYINRL